MPIPTKTEMKHALHPDTALDAEVLKQFRVIFKSVRKHFQSIEDTLAISGSQLWALSAIGETPGLRVTELAKAMSLHQSTASNLIEKLVEQGLVRRERSSSDGRSIRLHISETGKAKLATAPGPVKGLLPDALEKLPHGTLRDLHQNLNVLLSTMSNLDPDAGNSTPLSDN
ncbi:MarR family winged helix-turn-helix transcriptional regulator [Chitinimonas naiadis]